MGFTIDAVFGGGRYDLQEVRSGAKATGWVTTTPTTTTAASSPVHPHLPYVEQILCVHDIPTSDPSTSVRLTAAERLVPLSIFRRTTPTHPLSTDPLSEEGFWLLAVPILMALVGLEGEKVGVQGIGLSDLGVSEEGEMYHVKVMKSAFSEGGNGVVHSVAIFLWETAVGEVSCRRGTLPPLTQLRPSFSPAANTLLTLLEENRSISTILNTTELQPYLFGVPGLPHVNPSMFKCNQMDNQCPCSLPPTLCLCGVETELDQRKTAVLRREEALLERVLRCTLPSAKVNAEEKVLMLDWCDRIVKWACLGCDPSQIPPVVLGAKEEEVEGEVEGGGSDSFLFGPSDSLLDTWTSRGESIASKREA